MGIDDDIVLVNKIKLITRAMQTKNKVETNIQLKLEHQIKF